MCPSTSKVSVASSRRIRVPSLDGRSRTSAPTDATLHPCAAKPAVLRMGAVFASVLSGGGEIEGIGNGRIPSCRPFNSARPVRTPQAKNGMRLCRLAMMRVVVAAPSDTSPLLLPSTSSNILVRDEYSAIASKTASTIKAQPSHQNTVANVRTRSIRLPQLAGGRQYHWKMLLARTSWLMCLDSPKGIVSVTAIEVDRLLQARTETAADRRPALTLAIVGNQVVDLRCGVQLVLDVRLLKCAGGNPSAQRPGGAVKRGIPPTRGSRLEAGDDAVHVGFAAAPVSIPRSAWVHRRRRASQFGACLLRRQRRQCRRIQQRSVMAGRFCDDAAAMAGQVVLPARVLAGRVGLGAQRCTRASPHVTPAGRRHRLGERHHNAPARRCGRMRPGRVSEPVDTGQALRIGRYAVQVEHQRTDRLDAGVSARARAAGIACRRPAAAAALAIEDLELAEQLAQLVEAHGLLFNGWPVDTGEQRDRE